MDVLYLDSDLLVINKPSGIALFADRARESSDGATLWSQLKNEFGKLYPIHRIDKGTSGVLAIARNQSTQASITADFAARIPHKYYLAWVAGDFPKGTHAIDLPLCRGRKSRYRVAAPRERIRLGARRFSVTADRDGVEALTYVRRIAFKRETDRDISLLMVKPKTGRTHQIRVHLSWIGFPVLGDHLYGKPGSHAQSAVRLLLHAHKLILQTHPDRPASFTAELTRDFPTETACSR